MCFPMMCTCSSIQSITEQGYYIFWMVKLSTYFLSERLFLHFLKPLPCPWPGYLSADLCLLIKLVHGKSKTQAMSHQCTCFCEGSANDDEEDIPLKHLMTVLCALVQGTLVPPLQSPDWLLSICNTYLQYHRCSSRWSRGSFLSSVVFSFLAKRRKIEHFKNPSVL